jgi:site-specific DNA recombinase
MLQGNSIENNQSLRAGFYARVSTAEQVKYGTIESQVAALEERAAADKVAIKPEMRFNDNGRTASTLVRPELERLRDLASADGIDRLYLLCPDRLARKYSHQMLLIDELEQCGVELVFLDHESEDTPEDKMRVQMQGVFAEYERAKIMERCRRGKLHLARRGAINVLGGAPYGYRYVPAAPGAAPAQYNVQLEHAAVVRQLFQWIGLERLSIGQACKRLENQGILSPRGRQRWDRSTVWGILKNPAYKGQAAFGKTRLGPMRPRLRGARGRSDQPSDGQSVFDTSAQEWISIAVPAIVEEQLFDTVDEQLKENQRRSRQRRDAARHLLQGLLACKCCGYAFYAKGGGPSGAKNKSRVYYRCTGSEASRFGGQRVCDNKPLQRDLLDQAVWDDVRLLLADPKRIEEELNRRLDSDAEPKQESGNKLQSQITKVSRGISRLIDAYGEGLLDKTDFEPRIKSARAQLSQLQTELQLQADQQERARELRGIVDNLQTFSCQVTTGLDNASWETKRDLIRTLVKRIEIDEDQINVVYRVDLCPFELRPDRGVRHYCRRTFGPTATREALTSEF